MAAEQPKGTGKQVHGISIQLTAQQKAELERFWKQHGSLGNVEIQVEVVNDKISPASIQVGTAK